MLLWGLAGGIRGLIVKAAIDVETLQPGVISQPLTGEGLLIKQEYIISAPLKGTLKFTVADGERIKSGATLATLSASSMDSTTGVRQYAITAPVSGVLCRHIDGLETVLVPGAIDVVEIPSLDKIENNPAPVEAGPVDRGQPVAKIVDNLVPIRIYTVLPEVELNRIKGQKQAYLVLEWQGQSIEAKVDKILEGKQPAVLLSVQNYPDELVHQRKITFTITTGSLEGLLVNEQSLVVKEGKTGLFHVWKGIVRWTPVEVTGRLQGQAAIRGKDIQPGIRYINNPSFAREGDRL